MVFLDFNCDIGEGCGADAVIAPWISSANIACGGHAGDTHSMREALRLCRTHGLAAGAHPGYLDPDGFGRRAQSLQPQEISALVHAQLRTLLNLAEDEGVCVRHVKPHGALYNQAARDPSYARAIAEAVADTDPRLTLYGLSGSALIAAAEALGLRAVHEVFAERGYDADGQLLPRGVPGAILSEVSAAIRQTQLLLGGQLRAADGTRLRLRADSLCLHGDRPDAADFARQLRVALEASGVVVRPPHPIHNLPL